MEVVGGETAAYSPRTVEEVFSDFKGRRAALIKALTTALSLSLSPFLIYFLIFILFYVNIFNFCQLIFWRFGVF